MKLSYTHAITATCSSAFYELPFDGAFGFRPIHLPLTQNVKCHKLISLPCNVTDCHRYDALLLLLAYHTTSRKKRRSAAAQLKISTNINYAARIPFL